MKLKKIIIKLKNGHSNKAEIMKKNKAESDCPLILSTFLSPIQKKNFSLLSHKFTFQMVMQLEFNL